MTKGPRLSASDGTVVKLSEGRCILEEARYLRRILSRRILSMYVSIALAASAQRMACLSIRAGGVVRRTPDSIPPPGSHRQYHVSPSTAALEFMHNLNLVLCSCAITTRALQRDQQLGAAGCWQADARAQRASERAQG